MELAKIAESSECHGCMKEHSCDKTPSGECYVCVPADSAAHLVTVSEPEQTNAATDSYRDRAAKAIAALNAIRAAIKSESEGRKHWGHVGTMGYVMTELGTLAAALGCDGYTQD